MWCGGRCKERRSRRKSERERERGKVVGRECGARGRSVWGYVEEGDETVGGGSAGGEEDLLLALLPPTKLLSFLLSLLGRVVVCVVGLGLLATALCTFAIRHVVLSCYLKKMPQ